MEKELINPPLSPSTWTVVKTYLFKSFTLYQHQKRRTYKLTVNGPRLASVSMAGLTLVYALGISAGYGWLRYGRQISEVRMVDVALFRVKNIRRALAVHQFAKAKAAWAEKKYTEAYIEMNSGLRNDEDNVPGRLQFARFLQTANATGRAVSMLEEGLARMPDNGDLAKATLDVLVASGRDNEALALLHGKLAPQFSGPNGPLLQTYEVLASLHIDGPIAARRLLEHYPDLPKTTRALPVVAAILWGTQDRLAAIETLKDYVKAEPDNFTAYADLADYQQMAGLLGDARQTADLACARFPKEMGPRLVRIAMLEPTNPAEVSTWVQEIDSYLKEFGNKPEAIVALAEMSGRKGWLDVSRLLYENSAGRLDDLRLLALYYSDALLHQKQPQEAQQVLGEIDRQTPGTGRFLILLLEREILAAAACDDHESIRDEARRLATALRLDPENLEAIRQRFAKLKISDAVAELTVAPSNAKAAAPKTGP
jgi:tetratricopeptide (TPR) repeat protein